MSQTIRRIILVASLGLSACGGVRSLYTTGSNAFHDIKIEVSPELQKTATVENTSIDRNQGAGQSFKVTGDIQYGNSCKVLSVNVSFINTDGVVLKNTKGPVVNYVANTKARFQASAYIVAMVGETKDIIDKVVLTGLECL